MVTVLELFWNIPEDLNYILLDTFFTRDWSSCKLVWKVSMNTYFIFKDSSKKLQKSCVLVEIWKHSDCGGTWFYQVDSGKAVEMSTRRGKGRQSILITDFFSPISSLFHQKQKETSVADSDAVDNIWIIPQKVDALKNLTTYLNIFFPFRWVLTVQVFTLVSSLW